MLVSAFAPCAPGHFIQKVSLAHLKRMQEVLKSLSYDDVNQLHVSTDHEL